MSIRTFFLSLVILCVLGCMTGCLPSSRSVAYTSEPPISSASQSTGVTPTETILPASPAVLSTPETGVNTNQINVLKTCDTIEYQASTLPNLADEHLGDSYTVTSLSFLNENTLYTRGWITTNALPEPAEVVFDFATQGIEVLPQTQIALFSSLCQECAPSLLTTSPDRAFQLAYYSGLSGNDVGIVLASQTEAIKLSNFTAYEVDWQWANDSSWVWVEWNAPEAGFAGVLVTTKGGLTIRQQTASSLLSVTNLLAFDPRSQTVVTAKSDMFFRFSGDVEHYDLTTTPETLLASHVFTSTVSDLVWDANRKQVLLQFVGDDSVIITGWDNGPLAKTSRSLRHRIFYEAPLYAVYEEGLRGNFALSPSGNRWAAVGKDGDLYVMRCR